MLDRHDSQASVSILPHTRSVVVRRVAWLVDELDAIVVCVFAVRDRKDSFGALAAATRFSRERAAGYGRSISGLDSPICAVLCRHHGCFHGSRHGRVAPGRAGAYRCADRSPCCISLLPIGFTSAAWRPGICSSKCGLQPAHRRLLRLSRCPPRRFPGGVSSRRRYPERHRSAHARHTNGTEA